MSQNTVLGVTICDIYLFYSFLGLFGNIYVSFMRKYNVLVSFGGRSGSSENDVYMHVKRAFGQFLGFSQLFT